MHRHLINYAREWINEIPAVPIYCLAKPKPSERAWDNQRGKKTCVELDSSPTEILRCWLFLLLRRRSPKASDCSPTNRERELGLDRRETVCVCVRV